MGIAVGVIGIIFAVIEVSKVTYRTFICVMQLKANICSLLVSHQSVM